MAACRLHLGAIGVRPNQENGRDDGDTERTPGGRAADRLVWLPVRFMAASLAARGSVVHRGEIVRVHRRAGGMTAASDLQEARGRECQHQQQDERAPQAPDT